MSLLPPCCCTPLHPIALAPIAPRQILASIFIFFAVMIAKPFWHHHPAFHVGHHHDTFHHDVVQSPPTKGDSTDVELASRTYVAPDKDAGAAVSGASAPPPPPLARPNIVYRNTDPSPKPVVSAEARLV